VPKRARERSNPCPELGPATPAPAPPRKGEGKDDLILLGEFGRAHGLRGEVRLKSFAAEPAAIASYGPLFAQDGRRFVLTSVRAAGGGSPDMLIARVEGVETREAAEVLNGVRLYAPRDRLPPPESEDEFLAADLIGLKVESTAGAALGTVVAVPNYGGGDLLEIAPPRGPTALLPFTKAFVPTVDLAGKRVVIDPPDDLIQSAPDEPV
jgi:16S rRNA processing protein RimM